MCSSITEGIRSHLLMQWAGHIDIWILFKRVVGSCETIKNLYQYPLRAVSWMWIFISKCDRIPSVIEEHIKWCVSMGLWSFIIKLFKNKKVSWNVLSTFQKTNILRGTTSFYYSNRNPLVTSFNVLLDNGRIPVALTNESSCSADCSQGIWI